MKRSLINSLKKRDNQASWDSLLDIFISDINDDSAQNMQLCGPIEYTTFGNQETRVLLKFEDVSPYLYLDTNEKVFVEFYDLVEDTIKGAIVLTYGIIIFCIRI